MYIGFFKKLEETFKIDIGRQLFKSSVAPDLWNNNILAILSLYGTLPVSKDILIFKPVEDKELKEPF